MTARAARKPLPAPIRDGAPAEDAEHARLRLALPILRCAACGVRADGWQHYFDRPRPDGAAWRCSAHKPRATA